MSNLTATERRVFRDIEVVSKWTWTASKSGWADDRRISSPAACARLVAKGLIEAETFTGPRGANRTRYRTVEASK